MRRYNSDFKLHERKRKRRFKKDRKKDDHKKLAKKKQIVVLIDGFYKSNPYKISKYSKFIQNTEKINQKLQHKVVATIKKD
jgi:hypothetical protein